MKQFTLTITLILAQFIFFSFNFVKVGATNSLTVKVSGLRNTEGHVQFSIYNKEGSIPDQYYKKHYRQLNGKIVNGTSTVIFKNLPKGRYAINVLHDENKNGIIEKGWIFPVEGIGFSNFSDIGFSNRPSFKKASFYLDQNLSKTVKVVYM
jgi:uncharacterized protein (DUF2141 family)